MTNRDDLLRKVRDANPLPNNLDLPDELADSRPPLALLKKGMDTQTRPRPTSRSRRWWRGPVIATAVMTLVLLIGGVVWLLRADPITGDDMITQPSTPVAPTEPVTSADDPAATTVVVPESAVPGPWTAHQIIGNFPSIGDVAAFGLGFVAVGQISTQDQGDVWGRGKIWTSVDGQSWKAATGNGTLFQQGHFALGVLANDSGGVVWGTNDRQGGIVILTSSNGTHWDLITNRQAPLDDNFTDGIALTSGGYLLYGVGSRCYPETGNCFPEDAPRLLVSADGVSWELVATPVTFTAITQTVTGELLGIGGSISEPTTWISGDDGQTWQAHGPDRTIEEGPSVQVSALESTPYGLIAAGLDADGQPTLWLSEDGKTFIPTLQLPVGSEPHQYAVVEAIAFGEGWVVAVGHLGTDYATHEGMRPLMWASRDGIDWQSVPLEGTYVGGANLEDIAYRDSVFVVVGNHAFSIGNAGVPLVLRWESTTD